MKEQPLPIQPLEPMDKDTLSYWKKEVKASLQRQKEEFTDRIEYTKLVEYFEGLQGKASWCIIDEFSPAILSVVSSVYYQNPTVTVEAGSPEADQMVKPSLIYLLQHPDFRPFQLTDLMRGSLIYAMKKAGMKEEMQIVCFDLMLAGYAAVEANFTSEHTEAPTTDSATGGANSPANPLDAIIGGVKQLGSSIMDAVTGKTTKSDDDIAEEVAQTTQKDIRTDSTDQTYVKRWNPLDILFDPRAEVFKESRWVGKKVRMTVAEFNAKYPALKDKVKLGDDSMPNLTYSQHEREENRKAIVLYELEIKKTGPRNEVLVLHPSLDEQVDYYERPIISNDFALKYGSIDKYGKLYPMSRAKKAKRPQDDINHYMTIQFEHVDRSQRKIAYDENALTESGKAAMRSSDVYALVAKNRPSPLFEAMPAPSVVPENKEIVGKAVDTLNKLIGTTELAKTGESQNKTLGQDQLQTQAFQTNVNAVQDALGDIAEEILDELKDIVMQTWDGNDYFKVTGIKGGDAWYDPSMGPLADILIGDYSVNVNIASAARPNPMKDRDELMQMTEMLMKIDSSGFFMAHGKRLSMEPFNTLVKNFNQNPEMVFEDLKPMMPPGAPVGAPGIPPPPLQPPGPPPPNSNANLVTAEGSRMAPGAAQVPHGGMA